MNRVFIAIVFGAACLAIVHPGLSQVSEPTKQATDWKSVLVERVPEYGHRNWIVIADSAYPAQKSEGIEIIVTHADQLTVVGAVLDQLGKAKHVRPIVYFDEELSYVPESDAPGIEAYRRDLTKLLDDRKTSSLPHEQILAKLGKAGESFKVLVLKTDLALPYTSVFLELDCGYWSPNAEKRLRDAMKAVRK
ncbi:MAG: hypothetical protein L0228_13095 [Planctomycetes bacterium]|nr:hypothetical protein [Planctomycetota bacterium]